MQMLRRMLYLPILHMDTNLINARQKLESVNQLERWYEDEIILINWSSTARAESKADGDLRRTKKVDMQIFTTTPAIQIDNPFYKEVEAALFPNGATSDNQQNDVKIVCEAAKYAAILITNDGGSKSQPGGILGNRNKLAGRVQIMSPDEIVVHIRMKISERDNHNRRVAVEFGGALPLWTDRD